MQKTKQIQKESSPNTAKPRKKEKKPLTTQQGDPIIKNLSDFITSIKIDYTNKPFYTGGRIQASGNNIYASTNQYVSVFGLAKKQVVDRIAHVGEEIVNFCVCPQDKFIVTFTQNSMLRVVHLQTKKTIHTVKLSNTFATDIQFSPNSNHLAMALGNAVHIYTFSTMHRTHSYTPTSSKLPISKLAWHPNPQKLQIITCDMQRNLVLFDYILNKVIATASDGEGGTQFGLSASGDLMVVLNGLKIKVYETAGLRLMAVGEVAAYFETVLVLGEAQVLLGGSQTELFSASLKNISKVGKHSDMTDNGISKILKIGSEKHPKYLLISAEQNITIARPSTSMPISLHKQQTLVGYNDEIIDIKNSKSLIQQQKNKNIIPQHNKYFVMVTNSNNFKIINKQQQYRLQHLVKGHQNTVLCCDFWYPFIVTGGKDNVAKLWRIQEQGEQSNVELVANYKGHSGDIVSVVLLYNSKIICTVSQDLTIKLWPLAVDSSQKIQIKSSIRTAIAHQKSINSIRASASQQLLATSSQDRSIKIWNHHLTNILTLEGHKRGVWDTAFHPVENMIVSAGGDGMIKGWSLETGDCLWSMGQGTALMRCAWVYYNQVVTGSQHGVVKVWDIRKQTSISYDKHNGKIWALDVTSTNKKLQVFTGATDSTFSIWHDNTESLKQQILHQHQLQQQQKIFYTQHIADKKYCQAAVIAFKAGYIKLFLNSLQSMSVEMDANVQVDFDQNGKLVVKQEHGSMEEEGNGRVSDQQFEDMVKRLLEIDQQRLLQNILTMTSTVKMYKVANRLLYTIFKQIKLSQLIDLNSTFRQEQSSQPTTVQQLNQKKSAYRKWLQSMISYEQKHMSRLNKYIKGTHWIQYLHKAQQPFIA